MTITNPRPTFHLPRPDKLVRQTSSFPFARPSIPPTKQPFDSPPASKATPRRPTRASRRRRTYRCLSCRDASSHGCTPSPNLPMYLSSPPAATRAPLYRVSHSRLLPPRQCQYAGTRRLPRAVPLILPPQSSRNCCGNRSGRRDRRRWCCETRSGRVESRLPPRHRVVGGALTLVGHALGSRVVALDSPAPSRARRRPGGVRARGAKVRSFEASRIPEASRLLHGVKVPSRSSHGSPGPAKDDPRVHSTLHVSRPALPQSGRNFVMR
ncbi:hypothetical protein C7974DRAFT_112200 [Boeremia exigua]|uniref:uncharacterized protein n=1 Tax=Boeremia exigua TaxID=749465 RepID=UPI001E8EE83C|nr:uncharacterized protein C7974DRAFT_112200 [Boeremia exigua]KAH6642874.1 hypothetical protein C7974DRAFT_112200 [Boeremia exigua]